MKAKCKIGQARVYGNWKKIGKNKTVDKRRLTDKTIDQMQNYFGEAIRNNVGNIELIENDTWAISKHMIR